jgi:hypothetical protein
MEKIVVANKVYYPRSKPPRSIYPGIITSTPVGPRREDQFLLNSYTEYKVER